MARLQLKNYVFTPGGAGSGTIKVAGNYESADWLSVINATRGVVIHNFTDPALTGSAVWTNGTSTDFPHTSTGYTTLTLASSTTGQSASDSLAIFIETQEQVIRPWPFGTDAIERMRISQPVSLIDADFEYGLQNTKWQSVGLNGEIPSIYELPGSELTANTSGYVTFLGTTGITNGSTTSITLVNQTAPWAGQSGPQWRADDYALLIDNSTSVPTAVTNVTANVLSAVQRTLTVANSAPFTTGDIIAIAGQNFSNITTTTETVTSGGDTGFAVSSAAGAGIVAGSIIMVETETASLWELMKVTNVSTNTLTVQRRLLGSNGSNVNIANGARVHTVGNVEMARVQNISDGTTLNINRGWYNTPQMSFMGNGSVISKVSASSIELVKTTSVSTAVNGSQTISRGSTGTTAISTAVTDGLLVRMVGVWNAGTANVSQVGVTIDAHGIATGQFLSTRNHANSNTEGIYFVHNAETNNLFYYPRRWPNLPSGYPLNQYDTTLRQGALYGGAAIPVSSFASDGLTPSTITVTTPYAHGLSPGTPILVDLSSGTNQQYGEGPFTVLSSATNSTFTYQAKSGAAVSGTLAGSIYVRPSAFFVHRPFDGGVNIGCGSPHHGAIAYRTSKKYFRYQSGKGLMWSSGTLLSTNYDVVNITADGTTALSANILLETEIEHGLQIGANVYLSGVRTGGYEGYYNIDAIVSDTHVRLKAQQDLDDSTPILGPEVKMFVKGWHGGSVRAGIFDSQNGMYWEYNGHQLCVVRRSSTNQIAGFVSVAAGSNLVTGDGTCRFDEQLRVGDKVVIRGMSHNVTSITDNNNMTVCPEFRGSTNQYRVKCAVTRELRVQQSKFNLDKIDGTGPSGYLFDNTKMQMLMIEYSWYGAGFIQYAMRGPDGKFIYAHRIPNNNVNAEAYMRSGNLPVTYQAVNETVPARLFEAIGSGDSTLTLDEEIEFFPPASPALPVYIQIDNEVIKYSTINRTTRVLGGLTRGASFTLWQDGGSKTFTLGTAASHDANVAVNILSCTSSPALNHWGSAVIMDGGFDNDRGFAFTFSRQSFTGPTSSTTGLTLTAFLMRLAPAVSNTIIGDLGTRDLINRAQLILNDMVVNYTSPTANPYRYQIQGILNPTNIASTTVWTNLNQASTGNQPSFTQIAQSPVFTTGTFAQGGERLFGIPVNVTNSGLLDLSRIKQIGNSSIPGSGTYPDGPEILAINVVYIAGSSTPTPSMEIQISYTETQA